MGVRVHLVFPFAHLLALDGGLLDDGADVPDTTQVGELFHLEMGRAVQQVRQVKVLDVVARNDVCIHLPNKRCPFLNTFIQNCLLFSNVYKNKWHAKGFLFVNSIKFLNVSIYKYSITFTYYLKNPCRNVS